MVAIERQLRDLHFVAEPRRRTHGQPRVFPRVLVPGAVGVEFEGLLRTGQKHFGVGVLEREVAHEGDFFIAGEFIGGMKNASLQE
jgi:hypothetical protein